MNMTNNLLDDLTGYKQAKRQIEWLKQHNWCFVTSCTGRPKVAMAYYNVKMGVLKADDSPSVQPNWDA